MDDFSESLRLTFHLLISLEPELVEIVTLSLWVSLSATALAAIVGLPMGAAVAVLRFPGRGALTALLNASMGLPPVVVGLAVYLLLSRAGPLGELGLLFTPQAMVIAQFLLITPIIAALARQTLADLDAQSREQLQVLNTRPARMVTALLWDGRFSLVTTVLAGFGRAIAEVGAVLIVGGNISGVTRVMTSTIALETSKGNLALALALGIILVTIALSVNLLVMSVQNAAARRYA
ncbi:ABC transporter permease [Wenzhouxiangella limi]|uniref:ABC transporter permease subunit n=1 Tax=Wenzhouxiangella limi TaxID=2707351 RepID=A0A845V6P2_9GAMM|nr:ABC transporter permease subunit [Wenzhouxiangella limi]